MAALMVAGSLSLSAFTADTPIPYSVPGLRPKGEWAGGYSAPNWKDFQRVIKIALSCPSLEAMISVSGMFYRLPHSSPSERNCWEPHFFLYVEGCKIGTCPLRAGWVWDAELTCERGSGGGLLAPWDFDLGMVTSGDGGVLNSITVNGRLAILPFQGDAVVRLGDATEIPRSIQACLEEERTFASKRPAQGAWKSDNTS